MLRKLKYSLVSFYVSYSRFNVHRKDKLELCVCRYPCTYNGIMEWCVCQPQPPNHLKLLCFRLEFLNRFSPSLSLAASSSRLPSPEIDGTKWKLIYIWSFRLPDGDKEERKKSKLNKHTLILYRFGSLGKSIDKCPPQPDVTILSYAMRHVQVRISAIAYEIWMADGRAGMCVSINRKSKRCSP